VNAVLVIGEIEGDSLSEASLRLVSAASTFNAPVVLGLIVQDAARAQALGSIAGVARVIAIAVEDATFDSDRTTSAIRAMVERSRPQLVLMPYAIRPASIGAAIAESLDLGFVSDVIKLESGEGGATIATRPVYGGKALAEFIIPADAAALLLLRADAWPAAALGGSPDLEIEPLSSSAPGRIRHREFLKPESGVDLTRADVIFAIGRGVGDQGNIRLFEDVAHRLGVALGASRPLVSAGWLAAPHQVGQTGVTVRPRLYVAFGISGAPQHLVGMQSSGSVVAVNSDKDAAIFDVADIGAVADMQEVAKQLLAKLG
jgi:electron transfer flavoprotein alpha subunit